jgi:L-asparaginase
MHDVEPIRILVTGGTFDKEYNELTGELYFKDTHVAEMLRLGRSTLDLRIQTVMMKDSLLLTAEDRTAIAEACRDCQESRIVVTHGTDTMVETARVLAAAIPDKTVVVTGALVPYKFGSSDGMFNLGGALAFVQVLGAGVYVAMNGQYFHWSDVEKNRAAGKFERISGAFDEE